MWKFVRSVIPPVLLGAILGFLGGEAVVHDLDLPTWLAHLMGFGAGVVCAAFGAVGGAVLGVVMWAVDPLFKYLPIGNR